jgi:tetratricopeptide (TPR) repeat protein
LGKYPILSSNDWNQRPGSLGLFSVTQHHECWGYFEMKRKSESVNLIIAAVLLAAITIWLFWPATKYGFVNLDDNIYVYENPAVLSGLHWDSIHAAILHPRGGYWTPILWISYMFDTSVFGADAFGYHSVNIILHAANSVLVLLLCRYAGANIIWSLVAAALFSWHPLRVEPVVWITGRKDVLSGFFFLLALLTYGIAKRKQAAWAEKCVVFFAAAALMVKPMVVTLPIVLLVMDVWPLRRLQLSRPNWLTASQLLREKMLLLILVALFSVLTLLTKQAEGALVSLSDVSIYKRFLGVAPTYVFYIWKSIWPTNLSIFYPEGEVGITQVFTSLLVLIAITITCIYLLRSHPSLLAGWLFFLIAILPVSGLFRVGIGQIADRFTYLPSIGLSIMLLGVWPSRLGQHVKAIYLVACLAILLSCMMLTRSQMPVWQSGETLFENALRHVPEHALANNNYGEMLLSKGKAERALFHFDMASNTEPETTPYTANKSMALLLLGQPDASIKILREALQQFDSGCPHLSFVLGLVLVEVGSPEEAIPYLVAAVARLPQQPIWRMELARAYLQADQTELAQKEFDQLSDMGFAHLAGLEGISNLYVLLWEVHQGRRSWPFFEWLLKRDPDNVLLLNNVAWLLATTPPAGVSPAEAVRLAQRANKSTGGLNPNILDTLAVAHAGASDFDAAINVANKARARAVEKGMTDLVVRIDQRLNAYSDEKAWGPHGPR